MKNLGGYGASNRARRRLLTKLATGGGLLAIATSVGFGASAQEAAGSDLTIREARNERLIREAFDRQVGGPDSFYALLADEVQWTIAGPEPSTYTSRQQFLAEGSGPVTARLSTPVRPSIRELYAEGDTVVAWWDGSATAIDGQPYRNSYAWIMTLREDRVVRVVAFLDTAALNELLERVQL